MTWAKREAVTDMVFLGDELGNKKKIGGLLIGTPIDRTYGKSNYVLVLQNGDEVTLCGSASLNRQIAETDVGKFIKCEFKGWGKSPNGKFKDIEVNVWEGEPTADMKNWPRFSEFTTKTQAEKRTTSNGKPAAKVDNDFADFDDRVPPTEEDDDLPF
jgi:hypothetical protein